MNNLTLKYKDSDLRVTYYFLCKRLGRRFMRNNSDAIIARRLEKAIKLLVTEIVAEEAGKELEESRKACECRHPPPAKRSEMEK